MPASHSSTDPEEPQVPQSANCYSSQDVKTLMYGWVYDKSPVSTIPEQSVFAGSESNSTSDRRHVQFERESRVKDHTEVANVIHRTNGIASDGDRLCGADTKTSR